jgi:iron complex outermembrane receptor protein
MRLMTMIDQKRLIALAAALAVSAWGEPAEPPGPPTELVALSLTELLDIPVITASKTPSPLMTTPSAIYVLTREDIRRSGARTIPDLLRLVPGTQVALVNNGIPAVSIRGFNQEYANKLLVLVDGRSIYTSVFSGVLWMEQGLMLEDVERIEVIRGPGSAVWGANAVNGVINIITRNAAQTKGGLVSAGMGSIERAFGNARYGDRLGEHGSYRIWAGAYDRDGYENSAARGGPPAEDWSGHYAGFRIDSTTAVPGERFNNSDWTLSGKVFDQTLDVFTPEYSPSPPYKSGSFGPWENSGGHILALYNRRWSSASDMSLRTYADFTERENSFAGHEQAILDAEITIHTALSPRHDLVTGAGYRHSRTDADSDFTFSVDPTEIRDDLFSLFAEYDYALVPNRLGVVIGARAEHYDSVGWEVQPSVRLLATPHVDHTLWAAVTRAVRTPSIYDRYGTRTVGASAPGQRHAELPTFDVKLSSEGVQAEQVLAYEVGYRTRVHQALWVDAALFINEYDDHKVFVPASPTLEGGESPYLAQRQVAAYELYGKSYGGEIAASWQVATPWRLRGSYSLLVVDMKSHVPVDASFVPYRNDRAPRHQAVLQSLWNVTHSLDLDLTCRYVDELPDAHIDDYVGLDLRCAWRPRPELELSLVGRDLLENHSEWTALELERSIYAQMEWLF